MSHYTLDFVLVHIAIQLQEFPHFNGTISNIRNSPTPMGQISNQPKITSQTNSPTSMGQFQTSEIPEILPLQWVNFQNEPNHQSNKFSHCYGAKGNLLLSIYRSYQNLPYQWDKLSKYQLYKNPPFLWDKLFIKIIKNKGIF